MVRRLQNFGINTAFSATCYNFGIKFILMKDSLATVGHEKKRKPYIYGYFIAVGVNLVMHTAE
jgi:hypothetical protein